MENMRSASYWSIAVLLLVIPGAVLTHADQAGGGQPTAASGAKAAAPVDLTGYWVSIVTEDWIERMAPDSPPSGVPRGGGRGAVARRHCLPSGREVQGLRGRRESARFLKAEHHQVGRQHVKKLDWPPQTWAAALHRGPASTGKDAAKGLQRRPGEVGAGFGGFGKGGRGGGAPAGGPAGPDAGTARRDRRRRLLLKAVTIPECCARRDFHAALSCGSASSR